jgi:hypothetical protein
VAAPCEAVLNMLGLQTPSSLSFLWFHFELLRLKFLLLEKPVSAWGSWSSVDVFNTAFEENVLSSSAKVIFSI